MGIFSSFRGRGSKAADKKRGNGDTKPEKLLRKSEIANMKGKLERVDSWLALENKDELSQAVKECFEIWRKLPPLQAENDRAEIVLSAFYQKGKIQDFLKKLRNFVERMDTVSDDDTAREMGYHNYLFFLEQFVEDMRVQYKKAMDDPVPESPALTPDNVAWFIGAECSQIAPIQELPKARVAARQMLDQAEAGKRPPEKFNDTVNVLTEALQYLQHGKNSLEAADELGKLAKALKARATTLRENIQKGINLYAALDTGMTEEWFRQFDPEASHIREMTRTELKAFYEGHLNALKLPEEQGRD